MSFFKRLFFPARDPAPTVPAAQQAAEAWAREHVEPFPPPPGPVDLTLLLKVLLQVEKTIAQAEETLKVHGPTEDLRRTERMRRQLRRLQGVQKFVQHQSDTFTDEVNEVAGLKAKPVKVPAKGKAKVHTRALRAKIGGASVLVSGEQYAFIPQGWSPLTVGGKIVGVTETGPKPRTGPFTAYKITDLGKLEWLPIKATTLVEIDVSGLVESK